MCLYLKHIQRAYARLYAPDIRQSISHIYARTVLDTYTDISACICMYLCVSPFTYGLYQVHMILYAVYIQAHTYTYGLKYLYVCEAHTAYICTNICTRYKAIHIAYARAVLDTYNDISAFICRRGCSAIAAPLPCSRCAFADCRCRFAARSLPVLPVSCCAVAARSPRG